ncbi:MAG: type II toxin-antitoxin system VapC family toxin [Dehalococcoidia bacterium]|nr:type II toxin-antitoxin system VapC family toxin [Dehalococcoidia bacterium]
MNSSVCIDASLALTWLLPAERNEAANALRRGWYRNSIKIMTASLFHAEVTSVLREEVYFGRLLPGECEEAFSAYLEMGVRGIDSLEIQKRAWELAKRFNLPRTYDMQYLAVAELNDCELWTNDKRLVNSLQGKVTRIRWVGEYSLKG